MRKILLVDDHVIFRDGMKALINDVEGYTVTAEADNGVDALNLLKVLSIDLVITDLHMPELDGLKLTQMVKETYPEIKIIVLTMDSEKSFIDSIKEMGAHGYITKSTDLSSLQNMLNSVFIESSDFQLSISERELEASQSVKDNAFSNLTKREIEILHLISKGMTDKEIAALIFLSPYTIITHRKNLLSKLGLSNKVELTRFALENNIEQYC